MNVPLFPPHLLDDLEQALTKAHEEAIAADPETEIEQMQGAHRRQLDRSRKRIAEVRAKERETVKAIEAEIVHLKDKIAQTKRLAAKAVSTDRALIAISQAALKMADEVEE
jgi:hypothetical protein